MTREDIARIIRESRLATGKTQNQVAKELGRPQQTIANWESGKSQPDANTLFDLFHVLGRSVDEAFNFKKETAPLSGEAMKVAKDYEALFPQGKERVKKEIENQLYFQKWLTELFNRLPTQTFAQNTKELRKFWHLSQEELAIKSGLPIETIKRYESTPKGNYSYSIDENVLYRIAQALEIEPKLLLGVSMTNRTALEAMDRVLQWSMERALAKLNPDGIKKITTFAKSLTKKYGDMDYSEIPPKEGITPLEAAYQSLNVYGRQSVVDRLEGMVKKNEYLIHPIAEGPQTAPAPQEGTDTTPLPDGSETPPEGE